MSCVKNLFRCNFTENENETVYETQVKVLQTKILEIELDLKSFKIAHDLEIKRIEDKIMNQMAMLTTKIDNLAILMASNASKN